MVKEITNFLIKTYRILYMGMRRKLKNIVLSIYIKWQKGLGRKTVHFIHIGKTGGTAIKNAISKKSRISGRLLTTNGYLFIMEGHKFTLEQVPEGEYIFFVVRDPLNKFISGFYSAKRRGQNERQKNGTINEKEDWVFEKYSTPNELAEMLSEGKETRVIAERAIQAIPHLRRSYWYWFRNENYLLKNKTKILAVLRQEYLNSDFQDFKKRNVIDLGELPQDNIKMHKTPEYLDKHLSQKAILNLKKFYRDEYRFLDILYKNGLIPEKY